jgi:hypothetical protein
MRRPSRSARDWTWSMIAEIMRSEPGRTGTGASAVPGLSTAMAAIPCGRNPRAWIATESFQRSLPPILMVTGGRAAPAGFCSQSLMSRPSNGIDSGSMAGVTSRP